MPFVFRGTLPDKSSTWCLAPSRRIRGTQSEYLLRDGTTLRLHWITCDAAADDALLARTGRDTPFALLVSRRAGADSEMTGAPPPAARNVTPDGSSGNRVCVRVFTSASHVTTTRAQRPSAHLAVRAPDLAAPVGASSGVVILPRSARVANARRRVRTWTGRQGPFLEPKGEAADRRNTEDLTRTEASPRARQRGGRSDPLWGADLRSPTHGVGRHRVTLRRSEGRFAPWDGFEKQRLSDGKTEIHGRLTRSNQMF
jgi:hypothetical protein